MKTNDEIEATIALAHSNEAAFAELLRAHGLCVDVLSRGFRSSIDRVVDYAHDVDLCVEGQRCQYKHRPSRLEIFRARGLRVFVDEQVKADRTPVEFYVLRFADGTVVAPYEPARWHVELRWDKFDRACKGFYTVAVDDCLPLQAWIDSFYAD